MFQIDEFKSELKLPNEYEEKVKNWLNNDQTLFKQIKNQVLLMKPYLNKQFLCILKYSGCRKYSNYTINLCMKKWYTIH